VRASASDSLACGAVAEVGCSHQPVIVDKRLANDMLACRWINTVLSNVEKQSQMEIHCSAVCQTCRLMTERALHADCQCRARPEGLVRKAELAAVSRRFKGNPFFYPVATRNIPCYYIISSFIK